MTYSVNNADLTIILNHFCHYISTNLPDFWLLNKNFYLKEVCFFSTGTYFNIIGKQKATELDKRNFFGSFLRSEVLDLVLDKFWYKPLIYFLRKSFFSKFKIYKNKINIIKYIYIILYKSFLIELNKIPNIVTGLFNIYKILFLSEEKKKNITLIYKDNDLLFILNKIFNDNINLLENKNSKNPIIFIQNLYTQCFLNYYKSFYLYSLKKYSLEQLPSIFPILKKKKILPSVYSNNFKKFFLYDSYKYGYTPIFFTSNMDNETNNKTIVDVKNFYVNNPLVSAFQFYTLKGVEVNRFKSFFKNYFLSNKAENWILKFENLFKFLKIKFFTSHFSPHLPKKKKNVYDSIISFYKWKIFVKKKMPYFFDGPWMSVPKNKIGRYWVIYIVNNISDQWFLKNKLYLENLHYSLLGYKFPKKKKITVKKLRQFYASYIYTLSKYNLKNSVIYNPYVIILNKFYLSPKVPFYLVNTEDNFGRFFEEYYYGHNKQLLYSITSLIRQEFAIPNSFLLRLLRTYTDGLKYQNKKYFSDDEDLTWDLNLSGYNSLYSGRSSTNGLHIFISYLYEDFFRTLVNLDKNSVPIQEKCKSDSLFFHTFNWDKLEPLD